MSFDTTFNFDDETAEYAALRNTNQASLNAVNAEITLITSCVGYTSIKSAELTRLTNLQTTYSANVDGYNATLTGIDNVKALNSSDKNILYVFFGFCGVPKSRYMCLMIANYTAMLADTDLIAIVNDNTNTTEIKNHIGQIVMAKYSAGRYC
jgi:hypothetical protein